MSNETEELVERVKKRLNILSKYSFAKEDEAMFNIVDVKELSQRLQAAEDINRIAALDLQAKEQECERLRGELFHLRNIEAVVNDQGDKQ